MPSKSRKQHNYMEMMAHNPEKARKAGGPSKAVAEEFVAADKAAGKFRGAVGRDSSDRAHRKGRK